MRIGASTTLAFAILLAAASCGAGAGGSAALPQVDRDGVAHLPTMTVPASRFMSPEARAKFIAAFSHPAAPPQAPAGPPDYRAMRADDERKNAPYVEREKLLWPVDIEPKVMGGVHVQVIVPKAGIAPGNRARVLINLHGGGFIWGEGNGARTESIPIAGVGRIRVITVAYRMAPEAKFPAASEDVAAVYRELLKDYRPGNIGIYGCSAGGVLAGEAVALFVKEKLPVPGAIGTFCGSIAPLGGDSSHLAQPLTGDLPFPGADSDSQSDGPYFSNTSATDPLVIPVRSPELLRQFPPTLLIAGSRDFMVSSLFESQAALSNAGVDAELHVWDGMWHAFFFDPDMPESREMYRVVVDFFDKHLGRVPAAPARSATPQG